MFCLFMCQANRDHVKDDDKTDSTLVIMSLAFEENMIFKLLTDSKGDNLIRLLAGPPK